MSQRVNTVEVKVREKSSAAESQAFQAEVVPNAVYEGRQLYLRLAEFLNLPYDDHYRAQRMVEDIEKFICRELENGNRLDFGLVSFLPRLSAALPTRDASPEECGIYVRGSVKARKVLSASLEPYLKAVNPIAGKRLSINAVTDMNGQVVKNPNVDEIMERPRHRFESPKKTVYNIRSGMDLQMYVTNVTIDRTMSDEGIWLENQMKRFRQKRNVIARAEVLDATSDPSRINFRFNQPLKPGKFMLVAGTRAGQGRNYRLRIVRTPINVLG